MKDVRISAEVLGVDGMAGKVEKNRVDGKCKILLNWYDVLYIFLREIQPGFAPQAFNPFA
jgi:hypothetical protein